jgi:homoserine dehydrogenase
MSSSPVPVYLGADCTLLMCNVYKLTRRAVGPGLVGTQVLHQLTLPHLKSHFRIDTVANSKYQLHISPDIYRSGIGNLSTLLPASSAENAKPVPEGFKITKQGLEEFVASLQGQGIFIDCTSSQKVAELYPTLLKNGLSIVTPNKKAFSSSQTLYQNIQNNKSAKALIYQESTVGAGLPIIGTLNDLVATGDEIYKIEGVLSGTLSYIFNEFSRTDGRVQSFSEIVTVAKDNGYTVSRIAIERMPSY